MQYLMLIPAITERQCNQLDRNIIYSSAASSLGWPGPRKPFDWSKTEYASSVKVTKSLVEQVVSQSHQLPEDSLTKQAQEGPEGVKWDWDWPKIWVGKWDLIHWDWDFCTGNGTQNIKWEWEFCFNPLSKKDFFRTKFKQKSINSVMEFYPIKK